MIALAFASPAAFAALENPGGIERLSIHADFRLRGEQDWDSVRVDGSERDDRTRLRFRARLDAEYAFGQEWRIGTRLRSGSKASQQSPHITLAENVDSDIDRDAVFDRWYVAHDRAGAGFWLGRNLFSFWKQNELFWDDDATPLGIHASLGKPLTPENLTVYLGVFTLPDGMDRFNGNLYAAQLVWGGARGRTAFNLAGGFFRFNGEPGARNLLDGNGERNYSIWQLGGDIRHPIGPKIATLGLDLLHNAASNASASQRDGVVFSLLWGGLQHQGDWQLGWYFARIEDLAVNASFAQDDWHRFGTANQTRASNFRGHELRATYAFSHRFNLMARFFDVESLDSVEDGKRFRLDLNFSL
ncbi:MAG: putative porin [Wenzhouxiangella sp.]